MTEENVNNVVEENPTAKTEETVPMSKYVGVKEMLRKAEEASVEYRATTEQEKVSAQSRIDLQTTQIEKLETTVKSLEEAKKSLVDPKEHQKVLDKIATLEKGILDNRRKSLTDAGAPEEEVKDLTEEQLTIYEKAVKAVGAGAKKSLPDGGKGGTGSVDNLSTLEKLSQGLADKFDKK